MTRLRVLIVEDQTLLRHALGTLLSLEDDLEIVGSAANGLEGVAAAVSLKPDVTLMDIQMPELDGVEATRRITASGAGRVVILTTYAFENYVFEAIKAGAMGYLLKDAPAALVTETIRRVARGEASVQASLASRVLMEFSVTGVNGLTAREVQVLRLVSDGRNNKEIARGLELTEGTVKNHVSNILEKLHAKNRTSAANAARERGLI